MFKGQKLYTTVAPATGYSLHLWLSLGTLELFRTHGTSLHTGEPCSSPGQTNSGLWCENGSSAALRSWCALQQKSL